MSKKNAIFLRKEKITVEKVEAARLQLNTAIDLWFHRGDDVSIHTLAAAAYQIVHDVFQRTHKIGLLYGKEVESAGLSKDEARKYVSWLKRPSSFFKHADFRKNKSGTVTFDPELSELFMLTTIRALQGLGHTPSAREFAFLLWNLLHRTDAFGEDTRKRLSDSLHTEVYDRLRSQRRQKFLHIALVLHRRTSGIRI